ncbi:DUF6191 domain-containing protein [Streptomyces sp. CT34]|uniref:DUF6191 domain-containing protein n=1 Tax=Streptomyces sp. CT34 TaxID=1553907 RepID=UPI0005B8E250|nr:DUF6191 domain-containing protein [Streptomyces sp. CT34]
MFNVVEELFAPGRKHTEEERQKLSLVVDDVGDGDPGHGPIDLASGVVVIRAGRDVRAAGGGTGAD